MATTVKFNWNKPIDQIAKDATGGNKTLLFMASEARRLMNPFVPMDTGTLSSEVNVYVEGDQGIVHYVAPYASDVYYGEGRNFSKEKHPLATAYWDKAAMDVYKEAFVNGTQLFVDKNS